MKRKLKKSNSSKAEIIYDDDTDSSDSDNLQSFHQDYMARNKASIRKYSNSDADDEVNENTSDDDDISDPSSNSSSDNELSAEEDINTDQTNQKNEKLESLHNRLKSLDKVYVRQDRADKYSEKKETRHKYSDPSSPENTANSDVVSERNTVLSKSSTNEHAASPDNERVSKEMSKLDVTERYKKIFWGLVILDH